MLKFAVVAYKRPGFTAEEFLRYFESVHAPLARKLPGLRKYVRNVVAPDVKRKHPGWDLIVELYFDDRESMEAAWASPEGRAATDDFRACVDLERTTWSVVDEHIEIAPPRPPAS